VAHLLLVQGEGMLSVSDGRVLGVYESKMREEKCQRT
jgi:hypothetical protein